MIAAATFVPAVLAANSAEITTSDVSKGAAFDNIKATWNRALDIGQFKTNLRCGYDYNENRDFLKEVSVAGDLLEGSGSAMQVSYDVSHNFKSKNTQVKLAGQTHGTTLSVDYDTDSNVKEVAAARSVDVADYTMNLQPSWLVKAKTARVKMMSALGGDNKVSAQVDYNVDAGSASFEVGYTRQLQDGKEVSTTYTHDSNALDVQYIDSKFEDGATWTATASFDTTQPANVLDATKLKLKRSWNW